MGRLALHLRLGSPHVQLLDHRTTGNWKVARVTDAISASPGRQSVL